ncbi:hypothetical protein [Consotaella aegiceratis]|uniref:hypothetical protein n=1 Tax=Consotaella aegiceratis TaxID=3097961 RepID=UPI002F405842
MTRRIALGQVDGVFGAAIAKPGYDVETASSGSLLLTAQDKITRVIAAGTFSVVVDYAHEEQYDDGAGGTYYEAYFRYRWSAPMPGSISLPNMHVFVSMKVKGQSKRDYLPPISFAYDGSSISYDSGDVRDPFNPPLPESGDGYYFVLG